MFYSFEKLQTIIQYGNNNAENLSNVIIKMGSNGLCEFNKWKICSFYDENISSLDSLCKEEKECELLKDISYCKWIIGLKDTKGAIERIQEYLKTVII